jgi:arsenite-transporting ATPase
MQQAYLHRIEQLFGGQVLAHIPEFERDITGLPIIARMAEVMFGGAA